MSKKNKTKDQNKDIKKEPSTQQFGKEPVGNNWNRESSGDLHHSKK